ncbi:hypothetical protein [Actinomadura sp. NPDC048394]|jgi:hypothetical protein|uniref:hypothetical protein n=1 Tax=Actinomadura sp. NPDC048394 TaxID=3158223 RepID=UPI0033C7CD78
MLGIYADLPWSYAAGAGIALAAAHQLRGARRGAAATEASAAEPVPGRAPRVAGATGGRHFALAMAYSVLIFVPTSLFVAAAHPQWATLQQTAHLSHGALTALAAGEVALTAAGFLITRGLLVAGRIRWAACQVILANLLMCLAVVHGPDGDGWKRFLSTDRAGYRAFPPFLNVGDLGAIAGHVADFLTSGLAAALYVTGALALGSLGLIMCVLHQFGLTDAGADGPGPLRAALVAGFTGGGAAVVAVLTSALVDGLGWVALAAVVPVLWVAVVARGAFAAVVAADLALPAEQDA